MEFIPGHNKYFLILADKAITDDEWHFVAFSYNALSSEGILVIDDLVSHIV